MKQHNFTLIEMLLVIAVAAILMGITVPAFSAMSEGRLRNQAAAQVSAQLSLARTYSVTNNCFTAVVMPLASELGNSATLANGVTRIAVIYKDGANYNFVKWAEDSNWDPLPAGVLFGEKNGDYAINGSTAAFNAVNNVPCGSIIPDSDGKPQEDNEEEITISRAVIFKPNGQVLMPSGDEVKEFVIRFAEGVKLPESTSFTWKTTKEDGNDKISYTVLTVNPLTARTKITHTLVVK